MPKKIIPVVLCGGSGTRLWPMSRLAFPKQFSKSMDSRSLFQRAATQFSGPQFLDPLVVSSAPYRFIALEQLVEADAAAFEILLEPSPKGTAAAVLAAAILVEREFGNVLMLVTPSDHRISSPEQFADAVGTAADIAAGGSIVTFGITPSRPETGYGWIELPAAREGSRPGAPTKIERFVEKPALEDAEAFQASGRHLWNSGIFLFSANAIIRAFETHAGDMVDAAREAVADAERDLQFYRLAEEPWKRLRSDSIDFAIMEKSQDVWTVECGSGWADLGDWQSVWQELERDGDGVSTAGPVTAIGCRNSHLRSEEQDLRLVGVGCEDIIAVATPDAVLVADRKSTALVKRAVEEMVEQGVPQAQRFPLSRRPWGQFETLSAGEQFQVKRITVTPKARLSLQSHRCRSEHWIVVEGTAKVTIGDSTRLLEANESAYIPLGARHRLENPGDQRMVLIEVQTGSYLGEDDIVRYEDDYARG